MNRDILPNVTNSETNMIMEELNVKAKGPYTPEVGLRSAYFNLFHEMQFRCTKNALMNYRQAKVYDQRGDLWKKVTSVCAAVSASGVLASILQKGQLLANKVGLARLVGLPICGTIQLVGSSTSEFVPSHFERAKKHSSAAAGWMQLAERAREMQIRMKIDPNYDLQKLMSEYGDMVQRKEIISKVLVSQETHKHFKSNTEKVYLAMLKRNDSYQDFLDMEAKHSKSVVQIKNAEDIYF